MLIPTVSGLLALVSLGCWLVVLVHAFGNSVWKGIGALLCGLYWLFYAIFEFEHEYKLAIVLLAIFGGGAATAARLLG